MGTRFFSLRYAVLGVAAVPLAMSFTGKRAETLAQAAPMAQVVSVPGAASVAARLPWAAGQSVYLTQDADDDCCSDHIGSNKWAYDFAAWDGGAFDVVAPQAGTVVHVKMSSKSGCGESKCVNDANYLVIDHGDGTQTTMLHLAHGSLDPAVQCGTFVRRGQRLATTGSTGWSTGVHLHVERDQVKRNLKKVCGCGPDGMACPASSAEWNLFWPSLQQPNLPTRFAEWGNADAPKNRRGMIGPSINVDEKEEIVTLSLAKSATTLALKGAVKKPGVYEVWARVPVGVSSADTTITVETQKGSTQGTLASGTGTGAFRPVVGLERVMLDGSERTATFASVVGDKTAVADALVLRRAGDATSSPSGDVAKK